MNIFINLTPHKIVIFNKNDEIIKEILSNGNARCSVKREEISNLNNIPVYVATYGDVTGLPEAKDNTYLIVSALVRMALPHRLDLVSPGDLVRNVSGEIVGCRSFDINC